jgi:hypothetical protein
MRVYSWHAPASDHIENPVLRPFLLFEARARMKENLLADTEVLECVFESQLDHGVSGLVAGRDKVGCTASD